ncbi:MAG: hypothetical protein IBJ14_04955 [Hydrogenophaga sp.]|nr:hypothetical protein [Hydrogenophaga sp.]
MSRKTSLGGAIDLCLEIGGKEPKEVQHALKLDKAQFSRWQSGQEGVIWPRLCGVMDHCGNDAPLLWMNHSRGYDLYAMRKVETELERENRELREQNMALLQVIRGAKV